MGAGRRGGKRATARKRKTARQDAALNCPRCTRVFLIGPEFVTNIVATGRTWPSGRTELRCGICGHTWWSRHPEALRKARIVARSQKFVPKLPGSRQPDTS
jgi:transcription elongation factor Elf1